MGMMDDFPSEAAPNDAGPLITASEMFMKRARGEYGPGAMMVKILHRVVRNGL
jgi:hypothetical protein